MIIKTMIINTIVDTECYQDYGQDVNVSHFEGTSNMHGSQRKLQVTLIMNRGSAISSAVSVHVVDMYVRFQSFECGLLDVNITERNHILGIISYLYTTYFLPHHFTPALLPCGIFRLYFTPLYSTENATSVLQKTLSKMHIEDDVT